MTIEDNSGPLDTGSIIVRKDGEDITSSVNVTSGIFTLMTDKNTTYVIDVKSSKGKRVSKTIDVNAKLDFTPPTVEKVITTVESMKLKLSATGYDKNSEGEEESGIDYFSYAISPTEGISGDRATGKIKIGESVEIETTKAIEYTITVTGTDNVGNVTAEENAKTEKAETRFNNRRS